MMDLNPVRRYSNTAHTESKSIDFLIMKCYKVLQFHWAFCYWSERGTLCTKMAYHTSQLLNRWLSECLFFGQLAAKYLVALWWAIQTPTPSSI